MTKSDIGEMIMNHFRTSNSKPNHIIDERWLRFNLIEKLNPKEKELVDPAIEDLVLEGFVTTDKRNGAFCIVLTEKGFDFIYPITFDETIKIIGDSILKHFAKLNSKPNHIIDVHWINFTLRKGLNPKEEALIETAINKLVSDELITTEDRHGFCMVLTQKGFDTIY